MDPAAIERAERALGQLESFLTGLKAKQVALISTIRSDERELEELNHLISVTEVAQDECDRDLTYSQNSKKDFSNLAADLKVEESSLVIRSRAATQYLSSNYTRAHNTFATAEKEGICGFSSAPGSTCTRAEAREREKKIKLLRTERSLVNTR